VKAVPSAERRDPGVEGNARLTAYVGVVLLVLLAVESATTMSLGPLLRAHVLIGLFLIPPVLLKLGSVGYRFVRYYTDDPRYRAAGPPPLGMRLLGPLIVLLTVVLFVSGIELWLFGFRYGYAWLPIHHGSFVLWFFAVAIHVANYFRKAPELAIADWRDHLGGAFARRSLVVASLVLGVVLAIAALPVPSAFGSLAGGG
jgi:hypothetical protein